MKQKNTEPERIMGLEMPRCAACGLPIQTAYNSLGENRYHRDVPECQTIRLTHASQRTPVVATPSGTVQAIAVPITEELDHQEAELEAVLESTPTDPSPERIAAELDRIAAEGVPQPLVDTRGDWRKWAPPPQELGTAAVPPRPVQGRKDDRAKPRWSLLPFRAIQEVVDVLEYGARKYAPDNWRHVEDGRRRYLDATLRHGAALMMGETHDPESHLHHGAHMAANILFYLELTLEAEKG